MVLTIPKIKEFEEVTEPVIKWLNENCHPHVMVVITPDSALLAEGVTRIVNDKFIKD